MREERIYKRRTGEGAFSIKRTMRHENHTIKE